MSVTIYHNPRCSKSRQALSILEGKGITPEVVEYLKAPLSVKQIKDLQSKLGVPAHDMVRKGEAVYKELGLKEASDADVIAAMAEHPILLERPVVTSGKGARICRPPELVEEII
jgi:arsenate reductase